MRTHTANDIIDVTVDVAQGFAGGKSRLVQEGIWFVAEQAVKISAKHAHRQLENKTPVRSGAMKRNIKTRVARTKHGARAEVSYEKPSNASVSYAGIVNAGGRSRVARMAAARALHHVGKRASHPAIHHVSRHLSQHAGALRGPHKAEHDIGFIDAAIEAGKEFMLNATVNAVVDGVVYLIEEGGVYLLEGAAIAIA